MVSIPIYPFLWYLSMVGIIYRTVFNSVFFWTLLSTVFGVVLVTFSIPNQFLLQIKVSLPICDSVCLLTNYFFYIFIIVIIITTSVLIIILYVVKSLLLLSLLVFLFSHLLICKYHCYLFCFFSTWPDCSYFLFSLLLWLLLILLLPLSSLSIS